MCPLNVYWILLNGYVHRCAFWMSAKFCSIDVPTDVPSECQLNFAQWMCLQMCPLNDPKDAPSEWAQWKQPQMCPLNGCLILLNRCAHRCTLCPKMCPLNVCWILLNGCALWMSPEFCSIDLPTDVPSECPLNFFQWICPQMCHQNVHCTEEY